MLAENNRKRKLDGAKQRPNPRRQADARPALFPLSAYLHRTFRLHTLHHWDLDTMLPGKDSRFRIAGIHMAHNTHTRIIG